MASQEDYPVLSKEQIQQLSRDLAQAISTAFASSTAFGGVRRFGYDCTGDEFDCLNEYHCHDPHDCHNKFGCGGKFICTHIFGG